MKKIIEFVPSKVTGGHYAFRNQESKKPFVNKLTEAKLIELSSKDIVVDIGAYVGEYTLFAARSGATVHSYEPTPDSFKLLEKNTKKYPLVICHQAAVTGDKVKSVTLNISPGIGVTNSIVKDNKAKSIKVEAVWYNDAIKKATVVKIDCEGAEYGFDIPQKNLRGIILEVHPVDKDWELKAKELFSRIQKAGFKPLTIPEFKNGWDMHATFIRK
jgi:FkbM family methyltransferase